MRTWIIAALVAAPALAHADPGSATATPDDRSAPTYVAAMLITGINADMLTLGGGVEVGRQVAPFASVHGSISHVAANTLLAEGSGLVRQARAGVDVFGCGAGGALCAFVGGDIGVQRAQYDGVDCAPFEGCDPMVRDTSGIGVVRAGIDAGHKEWRLRVDVEATRADGHLDGVDVVSSAAVHF